MKLYEQFFLEKEDPDYRDWHNTSIYPGETMLQAGGWRKKLAQKVYKKQLGDKPLMNCLRKCQIYRVKMDKAKVLADKHGVDYFTQPNYYNAQEKLKDCVYDCNKRFK
jgi:hypothetical protein